MNPFFYYLGRSLQLVGLGIITFVVIDFFNPAEGMEFLLYYSVAGIAMFYGGTLILEKGDN